MPLKQLRPELACGRNLAGEHMARLGDDKYARRDEESCLHCNLHVKLPRGWPHYTRWRARLPVTYFMYLSRKSVTVFHVGV